MLKSVLILTCVLYIVFSYHLYELIIAEFSTKQMTLHIFNDLRCYFRHFELINVTSRKGTKSSQNLKWHTSLPS